MVAKPSKSSIIKKGHTKEDVKNIRSIGNIRTDYLEREFGRLHTDEVIVTDERERHIKLRHPEDWELFEKYVSTTVISPDEVIKDGKNIGTVFMIKKRPDTNLNFLVRLAFDTDSEDYQNSVMTFYRLRDRNLKKLEFNEINKIPYKKE